MARSVLWPLAVGSLLHVAVRSSTGTANDFSILWRGGASLASGGRLYDPHLEFIYPPLAGWLLAPLGLLSFGSAVVVVVLGGLACAVAATVLLLRLVGVRADSAIVPAALLALAHSRPLVGLVAQGNVDTALLLAEAVVIGLLLAGRDLPAGVLLGAVCAVKPTLVPVLVALLILRRGRALAAAVASGAALTGLGLLTVPDWRVFFTGVLPLLAGGNRDELAPYNRSIHGAAVELGLPPGPALALRLVAFGLACWVAWRRRSGSAAPLEVVPLLMLGTLLLSSFSWANYSIYLLPLLVTAGLRDSLVRNWPAWAAVYLFATPQAWHFDDLAVLPDTLLRLLPLWGWLLLLATCAWATLRSGPGSGVTGRDDDAASAAPESEPAPTGGPPRR